MFILCANKTKLTVQQREQVTSGSVNVYHARFEFSEDWDGLVKTVYFRSGSQTVPLLLGESCECVIPWEVTDPDDAGKTLYAGVCGTRDGTVVLPTIEASLGVIMRGTQGWVPPPPTPGVYEQILGELQNKQDALHGLPGQVVGFDEAGNAVPVDMPSGGGGEGGGVVYQFGHGLKQEGVKISVDMASEDNPDKTLPVSKADVETAVGNIEILLKTI